MDWYPSVARDLTELDRSLRPQTELTPALYEVARRMVYATGDRALMSQLQISNAVLGAGATALAARSPILVDSPAVQVALMPALQNSFANPLYCAAAVTNRPRKWQPSVVKGLESLAQRYPKGLYVIGESASALEYLVSLVEKKQATPALVIATPPAWGKAAKAKARLQATATPWITVDGERGGSAIAIAIMDALIELTQASRVIS